MKEPLVSTIIPCYNRENVVGEAIESALKQDWPRQEVIVIDDGSTDATAKVCRKFGNSIILIQQDNGGVSAARNRGIEIAKGDFVAFLDSDDLWLPGKLSAQMEQLIFDDSIAVSATHLKFEPRGKFTPRYAETDMPWNLMFQRGVFFQTSTIITRMNLLKRTGGFPEGRNHWEDRFLWLNLLFYGKFHCIEKEFTIYRRINGEGLSLESIGHKDWVETSLNLLTIGSDYLKSEIVRECRAYIYDELPQMVCGSFWHNQLDEARKLGVLQLRYGPKRISAVKYLVASLLPGISGYIDRETKYSIPEN